MIERFWKPARVAEELGISKTEARELMRSGAISSDLYLTTKDDREYYRTTRRAVEAYQNQLLRRESDQRRERNYPLIHVQ